MSLRSLFRSIASAAASAGAALRPSSLIISTEAQEGDLVATLNDPFGPGTTYEIVAVGQFDFSDPAQSGLL